MRSRRHWSLRVVCSTCSATYSREPRGAPSMVSPCCSLGRAWSPTHTSGPRGSRCGRATPAAFQTRALPLLNWMRVCARVCVEVLGHDVVYCTDSVALNHGIDVIQLGQ